MPIKKIDIVVGILDGTKDILKNFLQDLFKLEPNMTLEKIAEVLSPYLDDTIKKYEERGLKYSSGKFSVKYVDKKHFKLEFGMYFQDEKGTWHKCANESDARDSELLEAGAWKTVKALKVITFPILNPEDKDESEDEPITKEETPPPVPPKKNIFNRETPSVKELVDFLDSANNWQEFETCLKEFLIEIPLAFKNEGIEDYSAKLFSYVEGDVILHVVYRAYYKENGKWVKKNISRKLDELEAPTWATKGLSATETDVTARYEKKLRLNI